MYFNRAANMKNSIDLTTDSPRRASALVPPPAAEAKPPASKRAASPALPKPKKAKPTTACALLWIPQTCEGGVGSKVYGVYATRADAEEARRKLLEHHERLDQRGGRGDICVGDTWRDEIKLVLRPAPLCL